jgi:aspartate racemase
MKKIGIVGGVSWPSTIEYYRAICQMSLDYHSKMSITGPSPMPEMCIESLNINYSFSHRGQSIEDNSWDEYDTYFNSALKRLEKNGVDFAIIASNTPHNRYDAIVENINIPVISIFEAVANQCKSLNISKLLLLGTEPTMNLPIYPDYLARHGVEAFVPSAEADRTKIIDLINELYKGKCIGADKQIEIVINSTFESASHTQKVVCLACTELPLAFKDKSDLANFEENGILYINTSVVHAKAAFDYATS